MSARVYAPRFAVADVPRVSTHLLKLALTHLVEQEAGRQSRYIDPTKRDDYDKAAEYIDAIDGELARREGLL